jgi:hypothetical protein
MLHPRALTKKEAAAAPPLVYQRQHHVNTFTSPDNLDSFNLSTVFEV